MLCQIIPNFYHGNPVLRPHAALPTQLAAFANSLCSLVQSPQNMQCVLLTWNPSLCLITIPKLAALPQSYHVIKPTLPQLQEAFTDFQTHVGWNPSHIR
jgi:hypothetical protein